MVDLAIHHFVHSLPLKKIKIEHFLIEFRLNDKKNLQKHKNNVSTAIEYTPKNMVAMKYDPKKMKTTCAIG